MFEHEVIFGHTRNIACHPGANGLGMSVECKVVVIGPDHDLMFRSQEQVSPMCERADDRQKFPVVHIVITFRWVQGLQVVSYCLEFTPVVPLI